MSNLGPYVDAIETGSFLGAGPGLTPDEVHDFMGSGFVDDVGRLRLRRDYGLVEFHFDGQTREQLKCYGITIQVHRLAHPNGRTLVPERCRELYGDLERFVGCGELLAAALSRLGEREVLQDLVPGFINLRISRTMADIYQVDDPTKGRNHEPGHGDVWSIDLRSRE